MEIKTYMRKCKGDGEEWCSIFFTDDSSLENQIVMGSEVMRDYYMIFDNKLSRIGFGKKKGETCLSETLTSVHGSDTFRMIVNIGYLLVSIAIAFKTVSGSL